MRRTGMIALVALAVVGILAILAPHLFFHRVAHGQVRMAQWKEETPGFYSIHSESEKVFRFDGCSDRVLVADAPEFHFGTNQDFSVEAWIKPYPTSSPLARKLQVWIQTHPGMARFLPHWLGDWISAHAIDNDFGVTPIVDKHQTPATSESIGFQLYLDHGKLACQLSQAPMRQLGFQNFVSPSPNLQDGHWHNVVMTVKRTSVTGGKLYVDDKHVFTFDPTAQTGDLSNSEPLRVGNHSNPNLRCFFKGAITGVALHRRVLSAEQISSRYRRGMAN